MEQQSRGILKDKKIRESQIEKIGKHLIIPIDELKLDEVIGKGYFGEVCKAKWNSTVVAIKYLWRSYEKEEPKFLSEIHIQSNLRVDD